MTKTFLMSSHLYKLQSHEAFQQQKDQAVGCEKCEKGFQCIPVLISKVIQRATDRLHDDDYTTRHVALNASNPGHIAPTEHCTYITTSNKGHTKKKRLTFAITDITVAHSNFVQNLCNF